MQLGDEIVKRLLVVFPLAELMIKNMLIKVDFHILPMRHRRRSKYDDAIERRLHIGEREKVAIERLGEADGGFGRSSADKQACDVFGAGLCFGDKKPQVK